MFIGIYVRLNSTVFRRGYVHRKNCSNYRSNLMFNNQCHEDIVRTVKFWQPTACVGVRTGL